MSIRLRKQTFRVDFGGECPLIIPSTRTRARAVPGSPTRIVLTALLMLSACRQDRFPGARELLARQRD